MICLICKEEFNEPRLLKELFRVKKYNLCLKCLKKYPLDIEYNHIPLDYHVLDIVTLFKRDKKINYDAFILEFSGIYEKLIETNPNCLILFSNRIYLNEEIINEYNYISSLLDKDIIVLTNILLI